MGKVTFLYDSGAFFLQRRRYFRPKGSRLQKQAAPFLRFSVVNKKPLGRNAGPYASAGTTGSGRTGTCSQLVQISSEEAPPQLT